LKNHYFVLGLTESATEEEIKKAYRKLAMELHPDKTQGDPAKTERFKEVMASYNVLSHEDLKSEYDASLKSGKTKQGRPGFGDFSEFNSFNDFRTRGRNNTDFSHLIVTVERLATIAELMDGREFKVEYVINRTTGSGSTMESRSVKININMSTTSYPIVKEFQEYFVLLRVKQGGSSQDVTHEDYFGRKSQLTMIGDLVVKIKIDMLGIEIEQSDFIQTVEISLHDLLLNDELILSSPLNKKYRIKSINKDTLTDLSVRIPEQGLISAFGNRGSYLFKISVKKPNLSNLTAEQLGNLKDLLIDVNK
jgi:DnaJ-class molecular chaperone